MWMDRRRTDDRRTTDRRRMDDGGCQVITIAYPEPCSVELKILCG